MHSSTVNKIIKNVDFYRRWMSCVTASVSRLGSLIIGGLPTITVHS